MRNNRRLLVIGAAESVSLTGTWITMMAIYTLVVFRGGGGVVESSVVIAAGLLPTVIVSPLTGRLSDFVDRRLVMVVSELLSGLCVVLMILSTRVEVIYVLLAVQAVSASAMTPARVAVVPDLVSKENLARANAFLQQLNSFVKIGAPILAGFLLALMSPRTAMLFDVASYVISAAILLTLPAFRPQRDRAARPEGRRAPKESLFQALVGQPLLRLLLVAGFLLFVIVMGLDVLGPVFTRDVIRGDQALFGLLIGVTGTGSVVATLLLLLRKTPGKPWRDFWAGLGLLAALFVFLGLGAALGDPALALALDAAGSLLAGIGIALVFIQGNTLLQTLSPPSLLGGFGGLYQTALTAGQLVGVVATPLLVPALLGLAAYYFAGALALVLLTVVGLVVTRGRPTEAPVAEESG
jgi:MFS family permease